MTKTRSATKAIAPAYLDSSNSADEAEAEDAAAAGAEETSNGLNGTESVVGELGIDHMAEEEYGLEDEEEEDGEEGEGDEGDMDEEEGPVPAPDTEEEGATACAALSASACFHSA